MPTWRQGIAVGEWRAIPNTAMSSAPMVVKTYPSLGNTGPSAKVIAWTGFAVDTRDSSIYSAANGGHSDYAGNEVNRLSLSDNAPTWTEPRASTSVSQIVPSNSHYADGRPASRHTYYGSMINEGRNRAMLVSGSVYGSGSSLNTVDGFNLAANDWDAAQTYSSIPSSLSEVMGAAMALHKSTGDIYAFAWSNVLRWSSASNTWSTRLNTVSFNGQYAASAVDTKRNRVLLVGGGSNIAATYDVAANTMQAVSLSGSAAGSVMGEGNGMVYDPLLDAYLVRVRNSGGTVYRINAATFAVDALPTTAGAAIPASTNGVYTRFLYVPKLKGIVYFPSYDGNFWFLRTAQ
jgi:hypothetical protein